MRPPRQIVLLLMLLVGVVSLPMILFGIGGPSPDQLAERIAASEPRWNSYQEDIKGQIGAAPVAEWSGKLIGALQSDVLLTLTFRLHGPWKSRDIGLPVLLRLPDGAIVLPRDVIRDGEHHVYKYTLPGSASQPWAEVQFPHSRERIYFDANGLWSSND